MTAYLVPLQPSPQRISIFLSGVQYTINYKWNAKNSSWVMDINDINDVPIVNGIPLITGADLLEQFAYLGIGGAMVVQSQTDPDAVPTVTSLGTTGNLFYIPNS